MDIFAYLLDKQTYVINSLREMVANYDAKEDTTLMDQSNAIFDNVRSIIKIDFNLLYPKMAYDQGFADELARGTQLKEDINYILDHAIMIHVDEPFEEYLDRMKQLLTLMEAYAQFDRDTFYPRVQRVFTPEDLQAVEQQLTTQTQHESTPAEGFRIY